MVDFSKYNPPGVYVDEVLTPQTTPVSGIPNVPAIVGPSRGYRIHTERVTLNGTTAVELAKLGIDTTTIEVTSLDGTVYAETTDYTFTQTEGADATPSYTYDNPTTLTRVATGSIADGETVYVSYRYTDEQFIQPQRFTDIDSVALMYGDAIDLATGDITSPLTLGARIAFQNGAPEVFCLPTLSAQVTAVSPGELSGVYPKLETIPEVGVVVPLPVGVTGTPGSPGDAQMVATDLENHVQSASDAGYFRVGIIGHDANSTVEPDSLAKAVASQRVVQAYPNRLNYYNGQTNQNIEVGGYYLAAAYAGQLTRRQPQWPLTKRNIRSFASLPNAVAQSLTTSTKNRYSEAGVAVTELTRDGRLVVRHGVTTDPSNVMTRELSLVRARDTLMQNLETTVERSGLIGTPIDQDTVFRVKGTVAGVLETAVETGLVVSYRDLKARQTTTDPTVIEVKFAYQPSYPLNYIVVAFTVDVQTGEFAANQQQAA